MEEKILLIFCLLKKKKIKKDVPKVSSVKEIDDKIDIIKNEMNNDNDEIFDILEDSIKSKKKK